MAYIGPAPKLGQNREVDDISSGFNGSTTAFTLQVGGSNVSPGSATSIIVSVNNVIQNPNTDYTINGSTITFTSAPTNGHAFFAVVLNQGVDTSAPADGSITTAKLGDDAVTSAKIADNAVVTAAINADAVTSAKIADNAVVTAAINADAVTGAKIADDSINSEHYVDGSIDTAHIADSQITSAKIADGTIVAGDLASNSVTTAKITDANVTTAKIADSNVTTAKIADSNVTTAKIADSNITTAKIADDAVTSAKLGAGAVDTTALGADAVTAAKIADDAVNSTHLDTNAVTTDSLGATLVTTAKIADDAITNAKVADDAIGIAQLSATGTASSSTFLRGDNTFAAAGGGKVVQQVSVVKTDTASNSTGSQSTWEFNDSSLRVQITGASTNNKFMFIGQVTTGGEISTHIGLRDGETSSNVTGMMATGTGNTRASTSGHDHGDSHSASTVPIIGVISVPDTNQHTYYFQFSHTSGGTVTLYINRGSNSGDNAERGRYISSLTVLEIEP